MHSTENRQAQDIGTLFYDLCQESPGTTAACFLQKYKNAIPEDTVVAINTLLEQNKIRMHLIGTTPYYFPVSKPDQSKMLALPLEERVLYELIKAADNKGAWIRDLKSKSGLPDVLVVKLLKNLESKAMIKTVRTAETASKKVYMLADIAPSKSVTGGLWFSESEFDAAFVDAVSETCHRFLLVYFQEHGEYPEVEDLHRLVVQTGITETPIAVADVQCVIDSLIYDGKVTEMKHGEKTLYRQRTAPRLFPHQPCLGCPLINSCMETSGQVTPRTCFYLQQWL
ncbi:MAG: DNA-directed RNA polymerase III subunit RPC6 [Amphiamblys sp. WSBS2006]|nr:MAG: DNA-directed RNA polymerase III subunit RPC6 [Amphiamblys sp. WSBS2006]